MNITAHLNEQFHGRWMGRGLTLATAFIGSQTLDKNVWSHIKNMMYESKA
jgi:hypothetical protein